MTYSYVESNRAERNRLMQFLDGLTDADLERRLPNGLRIADVLIHLAFWDRYACEVLAMWQREGFSGSHTHFEAVNAAILMLAASMPVRAAVDLVRESALAVDLEAERVSADLAQSIIEGGKLRTLERAQHRREHLDQMEAAVRADT